MTSYQVIQLVNLVFEVLVWLIVIRCILSFVPHNPTQSLIRFVYDITEPVMAPFRKLTPSAGGLNFYPIVAVLAIYLVQRIVVRLLSILIL